MTEPDMPACRRIDMNHRVVSFAMVCLLASAAACVQPDSAGAPVSTSSDSGRSGVQGTAVVDIGCAVLENSAPCPRTPLRARILVFEAGSIDRTAAVETGDDGRFWISLTPGEYELRGENVTGQPVPVAMPVTVTVRAGEYGDVTIEFDSGVRGAPAGT
jgi:hypothetical protein